MTLPSRKPGFLNPLFAKPDMDLGAPFERLMEPLRYYSRITGRVESVPRGFPTDYASLRIGDFELGGKTKKPAVAHDADYASGRHWKWVADLKFYELCRAEGLNRFRAFTRWAGVTLSPKAHKAWKAHRRGTTPGARFYAALKRPDFDSTTNHP